MRDTHQYFIGVDGGATKTTAVLTDHNEEIIAEARSGPSNYRNAGPSAAALEIQKIIHMLMKHAHTTSHHVAGVCLGLSGMDNETEERHMRQAIRKTLPAILFRRTLLVNDVFIGYASGTHESIGAAVIAGTGSNAVAFGRHGNIQRASGLGQLLSDEGSAYHLAVQALRAATQSYDQRGPVTRLESLITKYFGVKRMRDVTACVYGPAVTKKDIAALSPLVDTAAFAGDRVARKILEGAADELSRMAITVIRQARIQRLPIPLVLIGSVFKVRKVLLPRFKRQVRGVVPRVVFIQPAVPFAVGAARLAIRRFA